MIIHQVQFWIRPEHQRLWAATLPNTNQPVVMDMVSMARKSGPVLWSLAVTKVAVPATKHAEVSEGKTAKQRDVELSEATVSEDKTRDDKPKKCNI